MRQRPFALLALCGLVLTACAQTTGSYFAPTAAVVCSPPPNCTTIPESDLAQPFQRIMRDPASAQQFRGPQGTLNRLSAQREILSTLIKDALVRSEAKKLGIKVSRADVNAQLDRLRSQFPNEAQFEAARKQQGLRLEELEKFYSDQSLFEKLAKAVAKPPKPSEGQVRVFYEQNRAALDQQIRAAHVLICTTFDPAQRQCSHSPEDEALANSIADRARKGEDFGALARQYSKDPSNAARGGDLGYFTQSPSASEFEKAAFALTQPGQVSAPVKSEFGFHVIKLLAKGKTFEEARPEIEERMTSEMQEEAFADWLAKVVRRAKIRLNPKFGRFDSSSRQVVPLRPQVGSPVAGDGGASNGGPGSQGSQNIPPGQAPAPPAGANQPPAADQRPAAP